MYNLVKLNSLLKGKVSAEMLAGTGVESGDVETQIMGDAENEEIHSISDQGDGGDSDEFQAADQFNTEQVFNPLTKALTAYME